MQQYDITNKLLSPLEEFISNQKQYIEHVHEELSRAVDTEQQTAKATTDDSQTAKRKSTSRPSTKFLSYYLITYSESLLTIVCCFIELLAPVLALLMKLLWMVWFQI